MGISTAIEALRFDPPMQEYVFVNGTEIRLGSAVLLNQAASLGRAVEPTKGSLSLLGRTIGWLQAAEKFHICESFGRMEQ